VPQQDGSASETHPVLAGMEFRLPWRVNKVRFHWLEILSAKKLHLNQRVVKLAR
jgi:hypothetical protein